MHVFTARSTAAQLLEFADANIECCSTKYSRSTSIVEKGARRANCNTCNTSLKKIYGGVDIPESMLLPFGYTIHFTNWCDRVVYQPAMSNPNGSTFQGPGSGARMRACVSCKPLLLLLSGALGIALLRRGVLSGCCQVQRLLKSDLNGLCETDTVLQKPRSVLLSWSKFEHHG